MKTEAVIKFRKETEKDISFLIDGIIAAEKSGSDIFSYLTIFGISENEFREILSELLPEDVPGQEFCYSNYSILEVNGANAGLTCSWMEGSGLKSSSIIKGTLMQYYFPKNAIEHAKSSKQMLDSIAFHKHPGNLIIEYVYVAPDFRARGLGNLLIDYCIDENKKLNPEINTASITVLKSNPKAIKAYQNAGFSIVDEKHCDDPAILKLIPSDSRVLMEKII
ncbi:MAG: GNAT family N-acetyltransferase [Bacteroidetes bacterium]|nr:GNAT family N-acetyltransferase [Bacteroidota bacterium]